MMLQEERKESFTASDNRSSLNFMKCQVCFKSTNSLAKSKFHWIKINIYIFPENFTKSDFPKFLKDSCGQKKIQSFKNFLKKKIYR